MPSLHPPSTIKATAFFALDNTALAEQGGWSETVWYQGSDYNEGVANLIAYVNKRLDASCRDVVFLGGRVVKADAPHKVLPLSPYNSAIASLNGTFNVTGTPAQNALSL